MNTAKIIAVTNPLVKLQRDNGDGTFSLMSVEIGRAHV